jgi:branched-subunit amino acid aminotransferase/4-amino-4-deoxychorismate lyase
VPEGGRQDAQAFKIWINGTLFDKQDAKISVYDHGLLYGDGVFEGLRSYAGNVFRLDEHLARLWNSAKAILLEIPISREQLARAVNDTLKANGLKDAYIRLVVTRGAGTLGLDPNRTANIAVRLSGAQAVTASGETLTAKAVDSVNRFEAPNVVTPKPITAKIQGDLVLTLEPKSVTVVSVR